MFHLKKKKKELGLQLAADSQVESFVSELAIALSWSLTISVINKDKSSSTPPCDVALSGCLMDTSWLAERASAFLRSILLRTHLT